MEEPLLDLTTFQLLIGTCLMFSNIVLILFNVKQHFEGDKQNLTFRLDTLVLIKGRNDMNKKKKVQEHARLEAICRRAYFPASPC